MPDLLFGPAGVPLSAKERSTESGIRRVAQLGLGCMELEFVRGVKMRETTALAISQLAKQTGVTLSAHAPYFINLNTQETDRLRASVERLLHTIQIASLCGARSVVFHAAYYLNNPPAQVYDKVKEQLKEITTKLDTLASKVWIRPETTGKVSQFGTLEEVIKLSSEVQGIAPCIDFAHCHARTGKFNSYPEFVAILAQIENKLGRAALDNMHIHVSGIAYGKSGERKHLNMKESDFSYIDLARALKDYEVKGLVINESPNLEEDALLLQEVYNTLT